MSKITVIAVKPGKKPIVKEIESTLKSLQNEVRGYIQVVYPWPDQVGLVCDEEAKIKGEQLNRALRDENGRIYDIVAGTFLIVGLGDEDFCSLTDEQIEKFSEMFKHPEEFIRINGEICAMPI